MINEKINLRSIGHYNFAVGLSDFHFFFYFFKLAHI